MYYLNKRDVQMKQSIDSAQIYQMLMEEKNLSPSKNVSTYWLQAHSPKLKYFQSNEDTGKWCIHLEKDEVDESWLKIKEACQKDQLFLAKCTTAYSSGTQEHPQFLICVYTHDWSDTEDVQKIRQTLREIGFTQPLKYKRDIETINKVYGTDDEFYIVESNLENTEPKKKIKP